jgi:hypothetical protein
MSFPSPLTARAQHAALRIQKLVNPQRTQVRMFSPACTMSWSAAMPGMYEGLFVDREYELPWRPGPAPRILDLGGFIGLSVLFFLNRYPGCRLTCFEPNPHTFARLRENVERYLAGPGAGGDVTLVNKAVSDHDGTAEFVIEKDQPVNIASHMNARSVRSATSEVV